MLLQGRRAVVTGVGVGLGRDIALALAESGADVVVAARSKGRIDRIASEVASLGRRSLAVPTDVTDAQACRKLASAAMSAFGGVDILVTNAAYGGGATALLDGDTELRWAMEVNLYGTLLTIGAIAPVMRAAGGGSIVAVNTMLAVKVMDGFGTYAVSKAALLQATKYLAFELGQAGIRVNSVLPGAIAGRALDKYYEQLAKARGSTADEVRKVALSETALGVIPSSADIAGTVVYLSSDLARPVTGQAIGVNAGQWEGLGNGRR
jgi:NAD(P)-dependent dehydrogenase (short-subunit alcohol dehydrogenase family)